MTKNKSEIHEEYFSMLPTGCKYRVADAKFIDDLGRGILEFSNNMESYKPFMCYVLAKGISCRVFDKWCCKFPNLLKSVQEARLLQIKCLKNLLKQKKASPFARIVIKKIEWQYKNAEQLIKENDFVSIRGGQNVQKSDKV